ncbi:hypothetical protein EDC04DRAFT_2600354 [Pisolithus marmoratus]|nr:hypothetical protein EDC04DRAFT_2600354 [Pisolithus marmoratus]
MIPIHRQSFLLYQPLLAECAPSTREELDFDAIPIHHQAFPFPDDAPEGTLCPVAMKTRVPGGPIQEREMIQNVNGVVEITVEHQVTVPERHEHKIQNFNVVIGHFILSSNMPLECPPVCSQAVHRDFYIHHYGNWVQIWLRDGNQWLLDIRDGYHHPTLPEYHLIHPKFPQLAQLLGEFDHDIIIPLKEHFNLTAGREKEPRRDEVNPSKSVWMKFRLSDTLIITVLMFLFVLDGGIQGIDKVDGMACLCPWETIPERSGSATELVALQAHAEKP